MPTCHDPHSMIETTEDLSGGISTRHSSELSREFIHDEEHTG